jgi:hypothetical protein
MFHTTDLVPLLRERGIDLLSGGIQGEYVWVGGRR